MKQAPDRPGRLGTEPDSQVEIAIKQERHAITEQTDDTGQPRSSYLQCRVLVARMAYL